MEPKIRSSPKLTSNIDVSAFAAIMLFLVALFMVLAGTHTDLPTVSVELPQVVHPRAIPHARREDAMVVSVMRSGDIFFGGDKFSPDRLHERIRKAVKSGSEGVVYIKADGRAKYKWVKDVVDEVSLSGFPNIVFLVNERRNP